MFVGMIALTWVFTVGLLRIRVWCCVWWFVCFGLLCFDCACFDIVIICFCVVYFAWFVLFWFGLLLVEFCLVIMVTDLRWMFVWLFIWYYCGFGMFKLFGFVMSVCWLVVFTLANCELIWFSCLFKFVLVWILVCLLYLWLLLLVGLGDCCCCGLGMIV